LDTYYFAIVAKPSRNNPDKDLGGAYIHVFVTDSDIENARKRAIHYLDESFWHCENIELSKEILPEQFPLLDALLQLAYSKAQKFGICAHIDAWKSVCDPNAPIEIRYRPSTYLPKDWTK